MQLTIFASGSSGNCMLLSGGRTNILIDAGISARRLAGFLGGCGLALQDIGGVLITHEHSDHISGLKGLAKKLSCPIYAPRTVASRLMGAIPETEDRLCVIPVGADFAIAGLTVRAFHTPHDTPESVGYRVSCGSVFAIATDMGCVTEEVRENLRGATAVLIESNHDEEMLRFGPYPAMLKRRILSDHGHLSNENCALLARELGESGTEKIILGHLSRQNNTPSAALRAAKNALGDLPVSVYCAPELGCLSLRLEETCSE